MLITDRNMDQLALAIAEEGFTPGTECEVALVVDRAQRAGLDCPALEVLADQSAPDIARARAFGFVAMALARRSADAPTPTLA